jgi:uncharacterized protein YoxC
VPDITTLQRYGKSGDIDSRLAIRLLDETMQQSELQALGQYIQTKLQQPPNSIRLRIRCAFREEALLVLAEHLLHVEPDPRKTFTIVEEALQDHTDELMKSGLVKSGIGGTRFLPVRIYLRIAGYQQPYDSLIFSLKPPALPVPVAPLTPAFVSPPAVVLPPEPEATEPEIAEVAPGAEEISPVVEAIDPVVSQIDPIAETIDPVTEEIDPVAEAIDPVVEASDPVAEEIDPVAEAIDPVTDEVDPVVEAIDPVVSQIDPVTDEIDSVAEAIDPVVEAIDPVTDEIDPVVSQIDPVVSQIDPVVEAIDPVTDEIDPVVEAIDPVVEAIAPVEEEVAPAVEEASPVVEGVQVEEFIEIEEQSEPLPEPIAETVEPLIDWLPDWVPEAPIAAVAPVEGAISEAAIPEPTIEELIAELTAEPEELVPDAIAEEITPSTITIADLAVEPEPIAPSIGDEPSPVDTSSSQSILPPYLSPPEPQLPLQNVLLEPPAEPDIAFIEQPAPIDAIEPAPVDAIETVDEPEIDQPEIDQPEIDLPEIDELIISEPEISEPELDEPEIDESEIDELELDEPELDEPEIISFLTPPNREPASPQPPQVIEPRETFLPREAFQPQIPPPKSPPLDQRAVEPALTENALTNQAYPKLDAAETGAVPPIAPPSAKYPQGIAPPVKPTRTSQASSSSIMVGTAIALFAILGGWYVFSRPCVLGSRCEPLEKAQQISQASFQTVQTNDSAIAITQAYEDLTTANTLLKSIPSWSGQHQAAQTLLSDNEAKSVVIGQVVRTLKKANEAANRSQNPPHPLPEWREIQRLWRESIAALDKIPSDHAIYPFAQRKAIEYRDNLASINKRVVVEQQAQEEVDNAKRTAQLAETRTGIATSPEGWQDVYTSWQAAIDLLKNVPSGAAAQLEAEELLKIYQVKLTAAATRRDQENIAVAAYTEAIAQAEQAQSSEKKNQWQEAIGAWENALASIQKVAQGTTPYAQAQPLLASYKIALTDAQGGLRISEAIQASKPALDRACGGNPKVCQYDAAPTAIRVQITYGYDAMVESAMTSAQTQGNYTSQAGVVSQVNTFLQDLALISQTAQVPIDLYNANGSKFGTYAPGTEGFAAQ